MTFIGLAASPPYQPLLMSFSTVIITRYRFVKFIISEAGDPGVAGGEGSYLTIDTMGFHESSYIFSQME